MSTDRYLKEDPERAEAVLETIYRYLEPWELFEGRRSHLHDALMNHKTFLMEVFRAVRGERD